MQAVNENKDVSPRMVAEMLVGEYGSFSVAQLVVMPLRTVRLLSAKSTSARDSETLSNATQITVNIKNP